MRLWRARRTLHPPQAHNCALWAQAAPGCFFKSAMDTKLLEVLVCPVTKGPLDYVREKNELVSRSARLAYPVRDGIPIMLESEARAVSEEELAALPPRTPRVD